MGNKVDMAIEIFIGVGALITAINECRAGHYSTAFFLVVLAATRYGYRQMWKDAL